MRFLETKIPPAVLVFLFAVLMWFVAELLPGLEVSPAFRFVSLALLGGLGLVFALAGAWSFRRAGTTVNPITPQASSVLVVSGIYRFTRNPMYVGFLCVLIGWALFLSSGYALVLAALFVVYMNHFQIYPEERELERLFGEAYREYRSRVRRWL